MRTKGPAGRFSSHGSGEKGIALIVALLLLSLMSVLGIVMMVSVNSDTLINGYYGNYRGSFYAADSGLNISRQALVNSIDGSVSTNKCVYWATNGAGGCTTPPLSTAAAAATALLTSLTTNYGSFSSLNAGQGAASWSESFEVPNSGSCTSTLSASQTLPVTALSTTPVYSFTFQYKYKLCVVGQAHGLQQVSTSENGYINITVASPNLPIVNPFSEFGAFVGNYPSCSGALIPGTMGGKMYTSGSWEFGTTGSYIFTGAVSSYSPDIDYWVGGSCTPSTATSYSSGGSHITPTFGGGVQLGVPLAPLPVNDYNQKWAVLDGVGCGENNGNICGNLSSPAVLAPTNADMHATLKTVSGTAYPTTGASSGVYVPYSGTTLSATAGGIYVEGDAAVTLSTGTDTQGNLTQIYAITQGSTTTTITVSQFAIPATTTVHSGSNTQILTGIPYDLATSTPGTMLYVNGNITSLTGPGQGVAAIQENYQTTITANGNVNITGDLVYAHERVTLNAADSPTAYANDTQELGIYTATGNINLQSSYSNKNLEVDGSLVAISSQCQSLPSSCGFTVSGHINTFNNVGGQSQYNIFGASMDTENTYFDGSVPPPFFPETSLPTGPSTPTVPNVTTMPVQRTNWVTTPQ
jgi:Tfp pilus assembly protein PilX